MQLMQPVKRYLLNRHISVPEDWLTACIDWVLSEYSQSNVPFIQEKVHKEWLHANLTELSTCCLPPQVQDTPSTTIVGHFPLQVNSVRDISEPAYSQLLKVEGADTENSTVSATQPRTPMQQHKADRMLMLEMTDGTTTVEGMEYRPIPQLSANLTPGTKVMVFGTIKVRRGILFLTKQNITVLGGNVIDFLQTNDQRNTLIAALNGRGDGQQYQQRRNNDRPPNNPQEPPSHSTSTNTEAGGTSSHSNNNAPSTSFDDEDFDFYDDIIESEFDQDLTLENEPIQDPALQNEFAEDMPLEDEFDEDLDEFMSQL